MKTLRWKLVRLLVGRRGCVMNVSIVNGALVLPLNVDSHIERVSIEHLDVDFPVVNR